MAAPPDPAALELLLSSAREPLPYVVLMPGEARAEVQIRGLAVDSVELREIAVVASRGGFAACRNAAAPPVAFTVEADAAQSLRRRFEPGELVEGEDPEAAETPADVDGEATTAATAPLAAAPPNAVYAVALEEGWRLVVGPRVAVSTFFGRIVVSFRRGVERVFGAAEGSCELQLAMAPDDARRLQHLLRPGVRILLLR